MAAKKPNDTAPGAPPTPPRDAATWPEGWVAADGWLTDLGELGLLQEARRKRQEAEARAAAAKDADG